jgi:hypothetical protein
MCFSCVTRICGCGTLGRASPLLSGALPFGSPCCPSLNDIRHVGHEVSCSNHDNKQALENNFTTQNKILVTHEKHISILIISNLLKCQKENAVA